MKDYKSFEDLKKELGDNYDKVMYDMNLELIKQKQEAIQYIKSKDTNVTRFKKGIGILDGKQKLLKMLGEMIYE